MPIDAYLSKSHQDRGLTPPPHTGLTSQSGVKDFVLRLSCLHQCFRLQQYVLHPWFFLIFKVMHSHHIAHGAQGLFCTFPCFVRSELRNALHTGFIALPR